MSVYWGRPEVAVIGQTDADDPLRTYRNQNRPKWPRREALRPLRKSFCHRKGIEPTFREGSPRSCAKMWQSEIESRLGRIGVQHEPSR
jgi:hypothetical protein